MFFLNKKKNVLVFYSLVLVFVTSIESLMFYKLSRYTYSRVEVTGYFSDTTYSEFNRGYLEVLRSRLEYELSNKKIDCSFSNVNLSSRGLALIYTIELFCDQSSISYLSEENKVYSQVAHLLSVDSFLDTFKIEAFYNSTFSFIDNLFAFIFASVFFFFLLFMSLPWVIFTRG